MAGTKLVLLCAFLLADAVYGWSNGRATYYTSWGSGGDRGSCGFERISSRHPTGRFFAAWPDNTGYMCGKCVKVKCDPRGVSDLYGSYYSFTAGVCKGTEITVMITDSCPKNENQRWCSGDVPHMDLSIEAFSALAQLNGIMATKWELTQCPGGNPAPGCTLPAFATCGGANGPWGGKCCSAYLKCQQQSPYYWACRSDYNGHWGSGSSVSRASGDNSRRRTYRAPKRRSVKKSRGGCKRISKYRKCGGLGGPKGNKRGGRDGLWRGYCCAGGRCTRYNSWFWQCQ